MIKYKKILFIFCIFICIGCGVYLGWYYLGSAKEEYKVDQLKDYIEYTDHTHGVDSSGRIENPYVQVDGKDILKQYEQLYKENEDFIGWITIPDTPIDYPVMQTKEENEYYIHRDFYGQYSGSGLPFLDFRCDVTIPTDNFMIYGHNMKSGTMFASLLKYNREEYYKEHDSIYFHTIYGLGEYKIIAAFSSEIYPEETQGVFRYYRFFDANSKEEFDEYVKEIKALTPYPIEETAEYGDQLLTLSTCAYHKENGRFVVVAKKVNVDEKKN